MEPLKPLRTEKAEPWGGAAAIVVAGFCVKFGREGARETPKSLWLSSEKTTILRALSRNVTQKKKDFGQQLKWSFCFSEKILKPATSEHPNGSESVEVEAS